MTRPGQPRLTLTHRSLTAWLALTAQVALVACSAEAGGGTRWEAEIDTVGDTIVVRTLAGGIWGSPATLVPEVRIGVLEGADEYLLGSINGLAVDDDGAMYIYDSQVPALRKYDAQGNYVATIGRSGGGPGEYKNSDGGMAILPDGRLVLRDPGNARFQLWDPAGQTDRDWRYIGGFFTSTPLFVDTAGSMYSSMMKFDSGPPFQTSLVRYSSAGEPIDTVPVPTRDYDVAQIIAESNEGENHSRMVNSVPFSPRASWTFSPNGYFITGLSTRYAIDLLRPEGTLRIERVVEPIAVDPAEKANAEDYATQNMRSMVPGWRWNGPSIPDVKPPFKEITVAQDGRIWIQISQPGERIPEDELEDRIGPDGEPRLRTEWREPVAFDVFEPDGRFVGTVRAPQGFRMHPTPVISGDNVWAVVTDDLGIQQLVRMRVRLDTDEISDDQQ